MTNNKPNRPLRKLPPNPYNPTTWIIGKPHIGAGTWIGAFCLIDALHAPLTIGKHCDISSGSHILTHSTIRRCISEGTHATIDAKPTVIQDYCFIGTNAVIQMGSVIGHHTVIGAGCVVLEDSHIPPYSLVAGVPGKIIGSSKKFLRI